MSCRLTNWNIAWSRPSSLKGRAIYDLLKTVQDQIICLTESHDDFLVGGHHGVFSEPYYGYPMQKHQRKVTLWSKMPWEDVSNLLPDAPTGRFVTGTTLTSIGKLKVIGVCVPWDLAHVSTGRRDRRPWQDHIAYLKALLLHPDVIAPKVPTVILGDFNQTLVPPFRAPEEARQLLAELTEHFPSMPRANSDRRMVCHMLSSTNLLGQPEAELPAEHEGKILSDHWGEKIIVEKI